MRLVESEVRQKELPLYCEISNEKKTAEDVWSLAKLNGASAD